MEKSKSIRVSLESYDELAKIKRNTGKPIRRIIDEAFLDKRKLNKG